MFKILLPLVSLLICANVSAATPIFLDIARNADGSVKHMDKGEAIVYCQKQGDHLPTARELVQLEMSLGAKGFVDACDIYDRECFSVRVTNYDGSSDSFNYSSAGDHTSIVENHPFLWLWSSSTHTYDRWFGIVVGGSHGGVDYFYNGFNGHDKVYGIEVAVRCVSGR
jgi:hypothetical protein